MRNRKRIILILSAGFLFCPSPSFSSEERSSSLESYYACYYQKDLPIKYVPGEIIVKFRPEIGEKIAERVFKVQSADKLTGLTSLNQLNARYKVKGLRRIFKTYQDRQGRVLSTAEVAEKIKQRFPKRGKRAPKGIKIPEQNYLYVVEVPEDTDIIIACKDYSRDESVEYAHLNYIYEYYLTPNDPFFHTSGSLGVPCDDLWGLKQDKLNCEAAWDIAQGEGAIVAVIDSGVDYTHPDLTGNVWINETEFYGEAGIDDDNNGYVDDIRGYDFAHDNSDPMDFHGHGSHCAGIAAAVGNNEEGVIGVAPQAKIMALAFHLQHDAALQAVRYAADMGADIISISWGGPNLLRAPGLYEEFERAMALGCIVVAAAGNSNLDVVGFSPASFPGIIAVAATDYDDKKADFSNWGRRIDISAPGMYILSTMPDGAGIAEPERKVADGYYWLHGTSMACPHVAGICALIISHYPGASTDEVKGRLISTADDIDSANPEWPGLLGMGRVNAHRALSEAERPHIIYVDNHVLSGNIIPGETRDLAVYLKNFWQDAIDVQAILISENVSLAEVTKAEASYGDIPLGETRDNLSDPFQVSFSPDLIPGEPVTFHLDITAAGGYQTSISFELETGIFKDVTTIAGIESPSGFNAVFADYDNDGDLDLHKVDMSMGHQYNYLFRNNGDRTFTEAADEAGVKVDRCHGCGFGDYDNDGYPDLFVVSPESEFFRIFRNNGNGTFSNATEASGVTATGMELALLDYDCDGDVDFHSAMLDQGVKVGAIFQNNGDGTFTQIDDALVIEIALGDYDSDGDLDISGTGYPPGMRGSVCLFRNNTDGTFTDVTEPSGLAGIEAMNVCFGDYDNDGDLDVVLGRRASRILFRNLGNGTFADVTESSGVTEALNNEERDGYHFFLDYDNDGFLDVILTSFADLSLSETSLLLHNNTDGTFSRMGIYSGLGKESQGCLNPAVGDYDNDGDIDFYLPGAGFSRSILYENLIGNRNNWLKVNLAGRASNRDAVGARIKLTAGGISQVREINSSAGNSLPALFGLGDNTNVEELKVKWPSGETLIMKDISACQTLVLGGSVQGAVTIEEPGWIPGEIELQFQVRNPGFPHTFPIYSGTIDSGVTYEPGERVSAGTYVIEGLADAAYDIALKHANHIADMKTVVISGGQATGIDFTLWAGDADGDGLYNAYPDDQDGDNDVDLLDYYVLFYQYHGGLPLTTGYNADFDGDGNIDLDDYYGMYYGYQNAANPGNYYF